jgi:hypothetical protein
MFTNHTVSYRQMSKYSFRSLHVSLVIKLIPAKWTKLCISYIAYNFYYDIRWILVTKLPFPKCLKLSNNLTVILTALLFYFMTVINGHNELMFHFIKKKQFEPQTADRVKLRDTENSMCHSNYWFSHFSLDGVNKEPHSLTSVTSKRGTVTYASQKFLRSLHFYISAAYLDAGKL